MMEKNCKYSLVFGQVDRMLSEKIIEYLDGLVKIAEKQDYKIESITFYNTYAEIPSNEKNADTLLEMEEYLNGKNIEILSDGIEIETEDPVTLLDEKIQPFDPTKIKISMAPMALESLVKRLKNGEIDLNTDFQRKGGLWSKVKKSQLIESLLLKIPLPAFYFDGSDEGKWLIIDGLQRITAINEFIVEKTLKLEGLEFFNDLNHLGYDDLPRQFARRIDESTLIAYTVNEGTPVNVKYNIFKRLNTGGLELFPQEIRHALYQGEANALLKRLALSEEFLKVTCHSIKTDRMLDQEFILRFIAVCYYGVDKYNGIPEKYLNETMDYINGLKPGKIKDIEAKFKITMNAVYHIFGNAAFRKMAPDGRRRPINKAIYEMWCKAIFDLDELQQKKLAQRKKQLIQRYILLCEQYDFQAYVKSSDKYYYIRRMELVKNLTEEILRD